MRTTSVFLLLLSLLQSLLTVCALSQWSVTAARFPVPISSIAAASDTVYAAIADSPGVYRSTDAGMTWAPVGEAPAYGESLWLAGHTLIATSHDALFTLSADSGWVRRSAFPAYVGHPWNLLSEGDSLVFLGGHFGPLLRSADTGKTWEGTVNSQGYSLYGQFLALARVDTVLLVGGGSLYRSTNQGRTWASPPYSGQPPPSALCFLQPDSFFVQHPGPTPWNSRWAVLAGTSAGIFASTDLGLSWFRNDSNLVDPETGARAGVQSLLHRGDTLIALADCGVFFSTDGQQWSLDPDFSSLPPLSQYLSDAAGTTAIAIGSGIFRRRRGESVWQLAGDGLPLAPVIACPYGGVLYGLTRPSSALWQAPPALPTMFKSTDEGASWTAGHSGLSGRTLLRLPVEADVRDSLTGRSLKHLFAVFCSTPQPAHSTDGGNTWQRFGRLQGLPAIQAIGTQRITPSLTLVYSGSGSVSHGQANTQFSLSWDLGSSWVDRTIGLQPQTGSRLPGVTSIAGCGPMVFAACGGQLFRSSSAGMHWESCRLPVQVSEPLVVLDTMAFADSSGRVERSTDYGASWSTCFNGADSAGTITGSVSTARGMLFFSGQRKFTGEGILKFSTDGGAIWHSADEGLPADEIGPVAALGDTLYVGTTRHGLWRRRAYDVVNSVGEPQRTAGLNPGQFRLEQNFPNPFNPSTTIRYRLSQRVPVRLAVYDMLGRRVALLVNATQGSGSYTVLLDGSRLASGIYCYQLQAGAQRETRRAILLR